MTLARRYASRLVCPAAALAIYAATLAPTIQGFDSAELTVGAWAPGFVHAPGYPLYVLAGHAFSLLPFGDVGLRLNLMSAVFGSLSVLVMVLILRQNAQSPVQEIVPALLFATIPLFWSQALRAEVYTLHLFLMLCSLYMWRRALLSGRPAWYIAALAVLGLAMGNHPTSILLWGTLLLSLIWQPTRSWRFGVMGTALGILVAGALYLYFPLRADANPAADYVRTYFPVNLGSVKGIWWLVSARMFAPDFYFRYDVGQFLDQLFQFFALLWDSYFGVGVILGGWGWFHLNRHEPRWNRVLTVYFLANIAGYLLYHVVDKQVMFLPALAVWAIWLASGIAALVEWLTRHIRGLAAQTAHLFVGGLLLLTLVLGIGLNWRSVSLHADRRTYDYAVDLVENAKPRTLVVNGWVTAAVLDYLRLVEGRRTDVKSFNLDFYNLALRDRYGSHTAPLAQAEWHRWLAGQLAQRPLCFLEPLPAVPEEYGWQRDGLCWELYPAVR
jgi:hypothetical protein